MSLLSAKGWEAVIEHPIEAGPRAGEKGFDALPVVCWQETEQVLYGGDLVSRRRHVVGLVADPKTGMLRAAESYKGFRHYQESKGVSVAAIAGEPVAGEAL